MSGPVWSPYGSFGNALALVVLVLGSADGAAALQEPSAPRARFEAAYTGEIMANVRGGVRRGAAGLGKLDAIGHFDLDALLGWSGTSVFLYGLATHGDRPTELTGDVQVVSNIEAPAGVRLYEAWIQKNFAGPGVSVLAGLYDVNSEFDVTEEAELFLNSSFGIGAEFGASGVNGPSIFPVTSLGTRVQWHPTHQLYLQGAVLDGVPGDPDDPGSTAVHLSGNDGVLWTAEVGFLKHRNARGRPGDRELGRDHVHQGLPWRVAVGVWQYSRAMERIGGTGRVRGHPGAYLLAEFRPGRGAPASDRPLGVFGRVGLADGRTNRFGAYTGAGVTYEGAFPGRSDDVIGLGVAAAYTGDGYERMARKEGRPVSGAETTVELTYRLPVGSHLVVQSDIQWVVNPGTDPRRTSAVVPGLRVTALF